MRLILISLLLMLYSIHHVNCQEIPVDTIENNKPFVTYIMYDGYDTTYNYDLSEVVIIPQKEFKNNREKIRYNKLMRNVKKVYPLARTAGDLLDFYAPILDTLPTKKARDEYFDIIEDSLWVQYGATLKKFTMSQGAILIKLIDRECQRSSYQVIKDFRGSFSAFFYQTFARLWGYNLKEEYNSEGDDKDIEEIVVMIEKGYI